MNNGTENWEWATQKLKELASKENRQIDDFSFRHSRDDVIELNIKSRDKNTSHEIDRVLFIENENMRRELRKLLKMIVRRIKP